MGLKLSKWLLACKWRVHEIHIERNVNGPQRFSVAGQAIHFDIIHALPGAIVDADLVEFNPIRDSTGLTANSYSLKN